MKKQITLLFLLCLSIQVYSINGILIKTVDYSLKEKWTNTLGSTGPRITTCDTIFKGQNTYIAAIATDYEIDANSMSNILYSIKITNPDNKIYSSQENLLLSQAKVSNKNYLQMSDVVLNICFKNEDNLGTYKIDVDIIDKVSGKTKNIKGSIVLAELPTYNSYLVKDDNHFSEWIHSYYKNPRPEYALAYYMHYIKSDLSGDDSKFLPIFGIFLEIFKNNKFLAQQVMDCYENQDLRTKIFLLYLLYQSELGSDIFYKKLEGDEKATYLELKNSPRIDIYDTILDSSQLDILWSTFFASGSYKPIFKLIQTLDYVSFHGDLEKYKESNQTEKDRQNALNDAIYGALIWSLKSNIRHHQLVSDYCNWAYQFGELTNIQKDELKSILDTGQ